MLAGTMSVKFVGVPSNVVTLQIGKFLLAMVTPGFIVTDTVKLAPSQPKELIGVTV